MIEPIKHSRIIEVKQLKLTGSWFYRLNGQIFTTDWKEGSTDFWATIDLASSKIADVDGHRVLTADDQPVEKWSVAS